MDLYTRVVFGFIFIFITLFFICEWKDFFLFLFFWGRNVDEISCIKMSFNWIYLDFDEVTVRFVFFFYFFIFWYFCISWKWFCQLSAESLSFLYIGKLQEINIKGKKNFVYYFFIVIFKIWLKQEIISITYI